MTLPTPEPFAIDKLGFLPMMLGVMGPIFVILLIRNITKETEPPKRHTLRVSSVIGASLVLAVEIPYLVILGLMYMAYSGVRM